MTDGDQPNKLEDGYFDYQTTKNGKVLIYWYGKHVTTLAGTQAAKYEVGEQLVMARFTGSFKHGSERDGKHQG